MATLVEKSVLSPTLVGRAEQLEALRRHFEQVQTGQGHVVLLTGEAGIGKTRLVVEARELAVRQGFVVLQGNCFEPERGLPYAPLLELLHTCLSRRSSSEITRELGPSAPDLIRLLPELASHLPELPPVSTLEPELAKHRLFNALEGFFFRLAGERPMLVVIEDLHWSDETSFDFLLHLARRVVSASPLTVDKQRPILLLLTCRSEDGNPSLARFLVGLDRARLAHEILLAPLSRDGVEAMLRSIFEQERPISPEFLDAVYDLAEGNPFFVEEILKSLLATGDIFYQEGRWEHKPIGIRSSVIHSAPGKRRVRCMRRGRPSSISLVP